MNLCFSLNSKMKTKRNKFFSKGQKKPKCSFAKKRNVDIPTSEEVKMNFEAFEKRIFFFLPPGHIASLFSGAGVVSETPHPAV